LTLFEDQKILDFHTHSLRQTDNPNVIEIVSIHLGQDKGYDYFTIGMHPWWTEKPVSPTQKAELITLLNQEKCLAMGEMGLDNLKGPDMNTQMDILRSLLTIAEEQQKPVIIHCVRAFDQFLKIKKEFPAIPNWCVHGYGRHSTLAKQLIEQGCYVSLMPSKDEKYADWFEQLPLDHLFLETDSMPNVSILQVYDQVVRATGISKDNLIKQMNHNAKAFFGI
tara:strand:- start:159 stop:824 length:666 start_codon:yes stop_codon:yes gene_type:complete